MKRVAVTPMPAAPNTMNMPMVERTMPSSPNWVLPNSRAQPMPASNTSSLPTAVPVKVHSAPFAMRRLMSDFNRVRFMLFFLPLFLPCR